MITQSWDTALKGDPSCDYSVCTTWLEQEGKHYLMNVVRERLDFPELKRRAIELHAAFRPTGILVEAAGSGISLSQELRAAPHHFAIIERKPERDKECRLAATLPLFEAGMVCLPRTADWLVDYEKELLGFPSTKYKDQVDSTSQYLNWALERARSASFHVYWPDAPSGAPSADDLLSVRRFY